MDNPALDPDFQQWFRERPMMIQDMVLKNPPWQPYSLNDDGDTYWVYGYCEDRTVTVTRVCGGVPLWKVFGIDPADLTPVS